MYNLKNSLRNIETFLIDNIQMRLMCLVNVVKILLDISGVISNFFLTNYTKLCKK